MSATILATHRIDRSGRLFAIDAVLENSSPPEDDSLRSLRFLLREVARARAAGDATALARAVNEILTIESWAISQKVKAYGFQVTGNAWVGPDARGEVTQDVLHRTASFLRGMNGSSVGELRAGIQTCVRYAVISHVRRSQAKRERQVAVDPNHFTDGVDPESTQYSELLGMAANNSADDRVQFKESLGAVVELEPRAAEVLRLRLLMGCSSKEVAEELGLTPANVDQIVSRSVKKLARLNDD